MERRASSALLPRIVTKVREFAILAGYLWVCFSSVAYLKSAILETEHVAFARWIFALVKALVSAKFMLIGRALRVGGAVRTQPLIIPTVRRSLAFWLLLIVLTAIEEVAIGLILGRSVAVSLAELGGGTIDQVIATSFVLLLILFPYFAFRTLSEVLGDGVLARLFFASRRDVP